MPLSRISISRETDAELSHREGEEPVLAGLEDFDALDAVRDALDAVRAGLLHPMS